MKRLVTILNSAALASAKTSENPCSMLAYDEPKMPASMIK